MSKLRLARALVLVVAVAAGCRLITGAYDFQIEPATRDAGAGGLCAACARADLRHPPCAPSANTTSGDGTFVYAMRSMSFGAARSAWTSPTYAAGADQDCSDCSDGKPRGCSAPPGATPCVALPAGVDNSFATKVLEPLGRAGGEIDAIVNGWIADGLGGLVVVVERWNGLPDDAAVTVRLLPAAHPAGAGAPSFAADEIWNVYEDGAATSAAYVSGGVLVADFRPVGEVRFHLGSREGAFFPLSLFNVTMFGALGASGLTGVSVAGQVQSRGQRAPSFSAALGQLVAGCDPGACGRAEAVVNGVIEQAYDLPLVEEGARCDAISAGFVFSAPRIRGTGSVLSVNGDGGPTSCDAGGCAAPDAAVRD